MWLWCARIAWALLPVATGSALGDALESWDTAPARVAVSLMWLVWSAGIVALFVPLSIWRYRRMS